MKKIIAWLLVLTLTAAVSIGATLAYLTDTDEDVNVMTLGKVKIEQLEYERIDDETKDTDAKVQEFHDNKPLYPAVTEEGFDYTPGDPYVDWEQIGKDGYTSEIWDPDKINNEIDKMVFVKNKGDYDAYVRSVIAFEAVPGWTFQDFQDKIHLNVNTNEDVISWEWVETPVTIGEGTYFVAVATYKEALKPGELTEISLSQIALDSSATNEDMEALGDTYNVLVKTQAIQADGFPDAKTALNEGFSSIAESNVPFTTDQPIKGIDVRSALRFYRGDPNQPIHTEVTNVVFGLNKDYPEIVNNYDGTLVTEEQDVDVYSYYVQENGKYTVYFLANGTIYSPKDSSGLYKNMQKLTEVETYNYDVSRVEDMYGMFWNCKLLTSLDTSEWDTSSVTNSAGMFANCHVLAELDTSGWDLSNNTTTFYMFQNCYKLRELDATNWGLDNVTNMEGTFKSCQSLKNVHISDWDVSNVTTMASMFYDCQSLESIDGSSWDVSNVTSMFNMFTYCYSMKSLDATGWDTSAVKTTSSMFFHNKQLENITGIENWNLSANESLYYMFEECGSLTELNLSGWNLAAAVDMRGVFFNCGGLKSVNVSGWDTSHVNNMYAMFHRCTSLEEVIGIGGWDVSNVTDMEQMFRNCRELETLDVGSWRPGKVVTFSSMFSDIDQNTGAMKLRDLDVSQWDMSSAEDLNWMFYGCGQLTDLDLRAWDVSNVKSMYHTFADCFKMENYNFSGWNTESLEDINGIFNSNRALKVIDVSDFDTQNVHTFAQLFDGASSLETVIGMDQWDTSSALYFWELFTGTKVKEVDLSSFDMSKVLRTDSMFSGNSELTTIYVSDKWNLDQAQLKDSAGMFGGNPKLTGANGTTTSGNPTDATYARVDTPAVVDTEGNVITEAVPGYLTHINDKPANP